MTPSKPVRVSTRTVAVSVFLLLVAGALVTSTGSGLAVPDWPNSFGHNMLLYPVSEMKGGVFYEHSHRLFGMLVGIVVLASATTIWRTDRRPAPRLLSLALVVAVIAQGVLGGLRVTGNATDSMDPSKLAPSTTLAIVHGILAQCVLALAFVTAAAASPRWSEWVPVAARRGVRALPACAAAPATGANAPEPPSSRRGQALDPHRQARHRRRRAAAAGAGLDRPDAVGDLAARGRRGRG